MHRIDAPGFAPGNLFTEGNPALNIPATEVSDDWLNDVQGELVTVIEGAGSTLVKGTITQLQSAIFAIAGGSGTDSKFDPLLNTTANQVITGLVFDKATVKAAIIPFDVHRETDSSNVQEVGVLMATHDSKDDVWRITELITGLDNAGVTFNITSTGQVRVSTTNLAGANYAAQFRTNGVIKLAL